VDKWRMGWERAHAGRIEEETGGSISNTFTPTKPCTRTMA